MHTTNIRANPRRYPRSAWPPPLASIRSNPDGRGDWRGGETGLQFWRQYHVTGRFDFVVFLFRPVSLGLLSNAKENGTVD